LSDLFFTQLGRTLLKAIFKEPWRKKGPNCDESVLSFFLRRAPNPTIAKLADALVAGIWAGDPNLLSMNHAFSSLKKYEEQWGSCLIGGILSLFQKRESPKIQGMCTLKNGLYHLIESLEKSLHMPFSLNTQVESLDEKDSEVIVSTSNGELRPKIVVLALPEAKIHALHPGLLWQRSSPFPHANVVSVSCGWGKDFLSRKGFGILAPSKEDPKVLGIIFDSCVFPQLNNPMQTRLTVMIGGMRCPEAINYKDEELFSLAEDRIKKWTGITTPKDEAIVLRAPFSIPQAPVGTQGLVPFYSTLKKRIFAIGPSIGGVSMNLCISSAQKLALELSKC
jgi:protoporphyrinogen/coproporphyrinogen III oxidase